MKANLFVISSFVLFSHINVVQLEKQLIYFPIDEHEDIQILQSRATVDTPAITSNFQQAVNRFSWNIFKNVKLPNDLDNLVISPVTLQLLLSALKQAAEGDTKVQLENVVGQVNMQDFVSAISNTGQSNAQLEVATGIFADPYTNLNQSFVNQSKKLKVDVIPVHFSEEKATRSLINKWASLATHGLIPKLLSDSYELQGLKLVLTSAIYFHSTWKYRFNNVNPLAFYTADRIRKSVPFMELKQDLIYDQFSIDGVIKGTIVEIPYENELYSMVILLPDEEYTLDTAIRNMRWNHMNQIWTILSTATPRYVTLRMPKFDISSTCSVVNALLKVGLVNPFTSNSKLPYIIPNEQLRVSDIFQQAVMKVDENGTSAAAAVGALLIPLNAGPLERKMIVVDRPFITMIFDKSSRIPIFISKVFRPYTRETEPIS